MSTNESLCSQCTIGYMIASDQADDDGNPIYCECQECGTVQLSYLPMEHQDDFHADSAKFKGFFGGYG